MCGIEEHRCIPFALEEKETQASLKNDIAEPASSLEEYIGKQTVDLIAKNDSFRQPFKIKQKAVSEI